MRNCNTNKNTIRLCSFFLIFMLSASVSSILAQIEGENGETLLGNEWVNFDQQYYKMMLAEDGVYRVTVDELVAAGFPISQINGSQLKVYYFGQEQFIHVSNEGQLSGSDYVEFVGVKNKGQLDRHLYERESHMLNPEYSLYTDSSAYFLTWDDTQGKRYQIVNTDLTGNTLQPEPFYMAEEVLSWNEFHSKPQLNDDIRYSDYVNGEGYSTEQRKTNSYKHSASHVANDGLGTVLEVSISGNNVLHTTDLFVDNKLLLTETYPERKTQRLVLGLDGQEIDNSINVKLTNRNSAADNNVIGYSKLSYPRLFNFDGASYAKVPLEASSAKRYLEFSDFNLDSAVRVFDPINGFVYISDILDDKVSFILNADAKPTKLNAVADGDLRSVSIVEVANFVDYNTFSDTEFVIVTSKQFYKNHTDGVNYLDAYVDHRESDFGGNLESTVVFVEDLYNQFAYGVNRHPLSIKNFGYWMGDQWSELKYCFLVGKGKEYIHARTAEQLENDIDPLTLDHFVPTYGLPGSDNCLLAVKGHSQARVPVGRIAVENIGRIKNYYEKIVERENPMVYPQTIEGRSWTKKVIHLAGGKTIGEITAIRNKLDAIGVDLAESRYGADIHQYEKQNADNIETALTDRLLKDINAGTSILAFYGHSTYGTFDFSLEKASQYNNRGRLPIIFSMGCNSGNIFIRQESISEDFVLEPHVGSIAFMAASGTAYLTPQGILGERFYQAIGSDYYGATLGNTLHHLAELYNVDGNSSVRTLNQQFTLHGDPAIKLFGYPASDFTIDQKSVKTSPSIVSPDNQTFKFNFNVTNIGEAINDSLDLRVIHYLPNGTPYDTIATTIASPRNNDDVSLTLNNPGSIAIGQNCISIELDYDNKISELPLPIAEANNVLRDINMGQDYCFYVLDDSANPISPKRFAIVNSNNPKLIANTSNSLGDTKNYKIQIDTTALFNSPLLMSQDINGTAGSFDWTPNINYEVGKVYYWRVSPDSTDVNVGYQWRQSSFIYLPNSSEGWNQSHYYQYLDNNNEGIEYVDRKLDFLDQGVSLFLAAKLDAEQNKPRFILDGNTTFGLRMWDFSQDGLGIVRLDSKDVDFYLNQAPGLHGSKFLNNGSNRMFFYETETQESRIAFMNHLENIVNEGDHVYVFTVTNKIDADLNIEAWAQDSIVNNGKNIFNVLESKGSTLVRNLEQAGTVPFCMVYTQGEEGVLDEAIAPNLLKPASISANFFRNFTEGDLMTKLIGPATSWDRAIWNIEDVAEVDTFMMYIKGVKSDGSMDTLFTVMNESEIDLSSVDAGVYPYLRLDLFTRDEVDRTPINVDFWRVLFDAPPELILSRDDSYVFESDTLNQGEIFKFALKAENISSVDMDSVSVEYRVTDSQNNSLVTSEKIPALNSGESFLLSHTLDTKSLRGDQQFKVELNYDRAQLEQNYANNIGVRPFFVRADDTNPTLDVTFDGLHIINGDIVSASPSIVIEVRDDNEYLLLDEEDIFAITLEVPDGGEPLAFTTNDPEITFEPATSTDNNIARITFEPEMLQDGIYKLLVQAKDATGNFSGVNAYQVEFEVISKQSVSNVFNYPNPFSTQTQFVFMLTGHEVPSDMSISIMTISGKVVKEISREELGDLRIGMNRTSYKWDGTDEYGEKLANGVYLYKVNLPDDMEKFETSADSYFEKGFGKLVILR